MRNRIVRVVSFYVFTVAVLLVIGLLLPSVRVGWNALWAGVVLTVAAMAVRPVLTKAFRSSAARSAEQRTRLGEKLVQYALVFVVELVVWLLTVWLSGVRVHGFLWGYVLPPLILLFAWMIYDAIEGTLQKRTGELYDAAEARIKGSGSAAETTERPSEATAAGRAELQDGLTPEQRRMLDELG